MLEIKIADIDARKIEARMLKDAARLQTLHRANGYGIEYKRKYALEELILFDDYVFLRNAYRAILGREPDPHGISDYLPKLRNKSLSKRSLLIAIRSSNEGKERNVRVNGLRLPLLKARCRMLMKRLGRGSRRARNYGGERLGS